MPADGISGKSGKIISATGDANRYLISNVADYDRGLSTLVLSRDENGIVTGAKMTAIKMSQSDADIRIDRLDIQRAQSTVLVEVDGVEYAIVSDDNFQYDDPYYREMFAVPTFIYTPSGPPIAVGGSANAKKVNVGGKIGIVKDPFGSAEYLGATLPLDGYAIVNLSVASMDSNVLLGQLQGLWSGNMNSPNYNVQLPSQTHVWNIRSLIQEVI